MIAHPPFRLFMNPRHGVPGIVVLPESGFRRASAEIRSWPDHVPCLPKSLPDVAREAGIASLHAARVASPGYAYAALRLLRAELARRGMPEGAADAVTFACAEGRGDDVAAIASGVLRLGARCAAFVTDEVFLGAGVHRIHGGYQDALRAAAEKGWLLVSAMAAPGFTEVPRDIMQGDRLVLEEALAALPISPTHVIVPGGRGGLAAAAAVQLRARGAGVPRLVVTEPMGESPLMALAEGRAGFEASLLAWQELERSAFAFLEGANVMTDVVAAASDPASRAALGLEPESRLLVLHEMGDTP